MTLPVPTPPLPVWLQQYKDRGFQLVFYPSRQKGPTGRDAVGWTTRDYTAADWHDGMNVGVKLGTEVSPGRFLVDIDFDWEGGMLLAKTLLPSAEFGFGRGTRTMTHVMFTASTPLPSKAYQDISGRTLVELRCRKVDGSVGLQTMLPPSLHPNGEVLELRQNDPLSHEESLPQRVVLYAIGCLFLFHMGERGFTHDVRLGMAGFLLQQGLEEDDVVLLGEAIADASGNSKTDVVTAVRSTAQKIRNGDRVAGRNALVTAFGDDAKKICARIKEWLGGGDFIVNDKDQILANSQENIRRALKKLDVEVSFNEFVGRATIRYKDYVGIIDDAIKDQLWLDIDETFHFRPELTFFERVLLNTARKERYHPVRQYLDALAWDGTPRLDEWLIKYGGAGDSAYTRAVSRLVLIACVRRIRQPGSKFDEMLILESAQGTMKSSALRALCPREDWFSDDLPLNVESKEIIERTTGKWIIEAAELSGMHRSRMESLKAFLSRPVDGPARLSYDRLPSERPRQFIIIGTTNSHAYLKDHTGNRRFWPVRVDRFNVLSLIANRDQLWAEAAHREANGEPSRLDESMYNDAAIQQNRRKIEDTWEEVLGGVFNPDLEHRVTTAEVFERLAVPLSHQDDRLTERVASTMQSLGFRRMTIRTKDRIVVKGWGRDPGGLLPGIRKRASRHSDDGDPEQS
jgi:predicted P-loop ATPase